jgi:hypothetical protein
MFQPVFVQKTAVFRIVLAVGPFKARKIGRLDDARKIHWQEFLDVEAGHAEQGRQFPDPGVVSHIDRRDALLQGHDRAMHAEAHHEITARGQIRRPVIHVEMR